MSAKKEGLHPHFFLNLPICHTARCWNEPTEWIPLCSQMKAVCLFSQFSERLWWLNAGTRCTMACWSPGNQLLSYPAQATHPPGISASSSTPSLCSSSPPPAGNAFRSSELHLLFLLTGSVQTYRSQLMQRVEYSVVIAGTDHEFPSAGSRRSPIPPLPLLPIQPQPHPCSWFLFLQRENDEMAHSCL